MSHHEYGGVFGICVSGEGVGGDGTLGLGMLPKASASEASMACSSCASSEFFLFDELDTEGSADGEVNSGPTPKNNILAPPYPASTIFDNLLRVAFISVGLLGFSGSALGLLDVAADEDVPSGPLRCGVDD